ncbi:MAG: tRNA (adenosine(37)-N6)-threonylcarbamoyltransferase complex dimerization subunit type 1 TsaB [Chromatiales bacterium]|jgi:tRNA threonylcarbamoyladenosine biosynthesis protein TsaB
MRLLAVETSTDACSAALLDGTELLLRLELAPREHTRLILPMLDSLLEEAGLGLDRIDAIAYGQGPGSFTGVRIAAGVVQGIAFAADLPVVAVSTLAAMAQATLDERDVDGVLPALDARMGEVYWGAYARDPGGHATAIVEDCVVPPDDVPGPGTGRWLGVGSGWGRYAQELTTRLAGIEVIAHDAAVYPHAGSVARLGAYAYQNGRVLRPEQAQPSYLRNRVAEKPGT